MGKPKILQRDWPDLGVAKRFHTSSDTDRCTEVLGAKLCQVLASQSVPMSQMTYVEVTKVLQAKLCRVLARKALPMSQMTYVDCQKLCKRSNANFWLGKSCQLVKRHMHDGANVNRRER